MGAVIHSEIPADFLPLLVREENRVICYGHCGVPVHMEFELTCDEAENARRIQGLRYNVWWHVTLARRGIDPDIGGTA